MTSDKENTNTTKDSKDPYDYHMKGLSEFGRCLLTGFLVWCTFNYPMSDTMQYWFYFWSVMTWVLI